MVESDLRKRPKVIDAVTGVVFGSAALITASATFVILVFFLTESRGFFLEQAFSVREFLLGTSWRPVLGDFGVLAVLVPTLVIGVIAVAVAMPFGISIAVLLNEYAAPWMRRVVKPFLEMVASVPTVVFGYFALTKLTPFLQEMLGRERIEPFNMLSAGLTVGLLITPTVFIIMDERFSRVPAHLREAPLSVGANRFEAFRKAVIPASKRTIQATFLLTFSRAVGESMIVSLAAGQGSVFTINPLRGAETMTGYIVRITSGDVAFGTIDYMSIFALAVVLYLISLTMIVISRRSQRRGMT